MRDGQDNNVFGPVFQFQFQREREREREERERDGEDRKDGEEEEEDIAWKRETSCESSFSLYGRGRLESRTVRGFLYKTSSLTKRTRTMMLKTSKDTNTHTHMHTHRLESVEKTFYARLSKSIKSLNLDKKESIKITAIGEATRPTYIPKVKFCEALCRSKGIMVQLVVSIFMVVTTACIPGSVTIFSRENFMIKILAWTVLLSLTIYFHVSRLDSVRQKMYRARVADSVAADTIDPATDVISYPSKLLWRVRMSQIDSFVTAIRMISSGETEYNFYSILVEGCRPLSSVNHLRGHVVLVCTHGSRDARCGRCGPPLMKAMKEELERRKLGPEHMNILATSHIGGHKFAGCMIVYPSGEWYGHVTKRDASMLIDHILEDKRIEKKWRGNEIGGASSCGSDGIATCGVDGDTKEDTKKMDF